MDRTPHHVHLSVRNKNHMVILLLDVNLPFIPVIHFSQNIETTGAKIVSQIRNGRKWKYQFAWNQAELSLIVWIDKVKGSILNNQIRLIHQFFKSLNVDSSPSNRHQFS